MHLLHRTRPVTHEARILKALKQAGHFGLWNHELSRQNIGGHRFSSYIQTLRKDGHHITWIRVNNTDYKYFLEDTDRKRG